MYIASEDDKFSPLPQEFSKIITEMAINDINFFIGFSLVYNPKITIF